MFRGKWSQVGAGSGSRSRTALGRRSITALSKCVGNKGGKGESSEERHRSVLNLYGCFASVGVWTAGLASRKRMST